MTFFRPGISKIFQNIEQIADIENWSIGNTELTDFQKKYLDFYKCMYDIYRDFKIKLNDKKRGYRGMVYKQAYELINSKKNFFKWSKIYFVGLNAFSKAEEEIVNHILRNYNSEIIWDTDKHYMGNNHEAGMFIRKYMSKYNQTTSVTNDFFNKQNKSINIYSCPNGTSQVRMASDILDKLELPYRILQLCGGDLGFTSALTFDFEVYSAGQDKWLEVSSVSNFESYQANRLKLRFKDENGKTKLCHTLNGSALALPRIFASLIENNQSQKGIKIPKTLQKYTGFEIID